MLQKHYASVFALYDIVTAQSDQSLRCALSG